MPSKIYEATFLRVAALQPRQRSTMIVSAAAFVLLARALEGFME
jgi:hypothetical protein